MSNSSSEDEGNPNGSEGQYDTEVGLVIMCLIATSHLLRFHSFQDEVEQGEVVFMDTSSDDDVDGDGSTSSEEVLSF